MRNSVYRKVSIAMLEFWSLVRGFEESVAGVEEEDYVMAAFERYNDIWIDYVKRWNDVNDYPLDKELFMEWLMEGSYCIEMED